MNKKKAIICLLILLFFISTRYLSYTGFTNTYTQIPVGIAVVLLFLYALSNFSYFMNKKSIYPSSVFIYAFVFIPIFTWITCLVAHKQSIIDSIFAYIPHYLILAYFLMAKAKLGSKDIINIIILFAVIRTILIFIEQFTYPFAPFAHRMDSYDEYGHFVAVEQRSGFYRFMIGDAYFTVLFSGIYSFIRLIKHISLRYIVLFFISIFGIYMDGSRQVMMAFVASIFSYPLIFGGKGKSKYLLLLIVFVGIMLFYASELFSELLIRTRGDVNDLNSRALSYSFLWKNEGDWYTQIFGHGIGFSNRTMWGKKLLFMHEMGIRPHDVGIIGAIYMVGWPLVILFCLYYVKVVFRNWNSIDASVRLYLLTILYMIPMIFPLYNGTLPDYEMFLAFIFYLVDVSILESRTRNCLCSK